MHRWIRWVPLGAAGVGSTVLCLVTTRRGVGIGPDSAPYLGAAHNILAGRGVTTPFTFFTSQYGPGRVVGFSGAVPLTHFPPLFPLAVAGLASLGMSVFSAARVLNAALFGVNLVLVGVLSRQVARSRIVSVAVMLLVLAGPVLGDQLGAHPSWLYLHSLAMSEPLFITWSLLALIMLSRYLTGGRMEELVGLSVFGALALLTRYVGISVVIAAVVAIVLWANVARSTRFRASGLVLTVGLTPSLAWALYNTAVQHGTAPRSLHVHPERLGGVLDVVEGWLTPEAWPAGVRHGVLLGAALVVAAALARPPVGQEPSPEIAQTTLRAGVVFAVVYAGAVAFTRDFVDASTPIDGRIFAPVQAVFYVLIVGSVWQLIAAPADHHRPAMATAVCGALCTVVALPALRTAGDTIDHGPPTRTAAPPILQAVNELPHGVLIATNIPDQVFLNTGRASVMVPSHVNALTGQANAHFAAQLRELVYVVTARRGVIVLAGGERAAIGNLFLQPANASDLGDFPSLRILRVTTDSGVVLAPS